MSTVHLETRRGVSNALELKIQAAVISYVGAGNRTLVFLSFNASTFFHLISKEFRLVTFAILVPVMFSSIQQDVPPVQPKAKDA